MMEKSFFHKIKYECMKIHIFVVSHLIFKFPNFKPLFLRKVGLFLHLVFDQILKNLKYIIKETSVCSQFGAIFILKYCSFRKHGSLFVIFTQMHHIDTFAHGMNCPFH